jgi:hypothetical protein
VDCVVSGDVVVPARARYNRAVLTPGAAEAEPCMIALD